ncbi:MAG: Parallel beta-helix repeat protein, partial [Actinobacteria bacterium 66_15]
MVVKFATYSATFAVNGTLISNGTSTQPVVFTSIKDDAHGGDTNNDGDATSPSARNWNRVLLGAASSGSRLTHTKVLYAGYYGDGGIEIAGSSPVLDAVTVADCSLYGIQVDSGAPVIKNGEITGATVTG